MKRLESSRKKRFSALKKQAESRFFTAFFRFFKITIDKLRYIV